MAALEAFEDAGKPYPIITGEDQEDFLKKWKEKGLTANLARPRPSAPPPCSSSAMRSQYIHDFRAARGLAPRQGH